MCHEVSDPQQTHVMSAGCNNYSTSACTLTPEVYSAENTSVLSLKTTCECSAELVMDYFPPC